MRKICKHKQIQSDGVRGSDHRRRLDIVRGNMLLVASSIVFAVTVNRNVNKNSQGLRWPSHMSLSLEVPIMFLLKRILFHAVTVTLHVDVATKMTDALSCRVIHSIPYAVIL